MEFASNDGRQFEGLSQHPDLSDAAIDTLTPEDNIVGYRDAKEASSSWPSAHRHGTTGRETW